jgi:DNA (cytosine-5)-methyltransferase 1
MIRALGFEPEPIDNTIELGEPELLRMDMSQAAAHFGIAVPIKRRDRKSGARKRKQHEIEAERGQAMLFDGTTAVA